MFNSQQGLTIGTLRFRNMRQSKISNATSGKGLEADAEQNCTIRTTALFLTHELQAQALYFDKSSFLYAVF